MWIRRHSGMRLAAPWLAAGWLALGCVAAPTSITGSEAQRSGWDPLLAELGQPLFLRHCASCHGTTGAGDGPVAEVLLPTPPDLRSIAARRGGAFPAPEISRFIDGRFVLAAHGSREMPVWGDRFSEDTPDPGLGESISRGKIATLVEFLRSIQTPLPAGGPADGGVGR